jgi:hypothetical protein
MRMIHCDVPRFPVTGHVVGKGLAGDGLGDNAYLVIDGVDARVHYIELSASQVPDEARIGAIVTVERIPTARSVDKTIASYAARSDGYYQPQVHDQIASIYVPMTDGTLIRGTYRRSIMLRAAGSPSSNGMNTSHWFHGAQSLSASAGVRSLALAAATGVSWQIGLQRDRGLSR